MSDQHKDNVRFHPSTKAQGFPAPDCYTLIVYLFIVVIAAGCQTNNEPSIVAVRPTDSPERMAMIAADSDLQAGETVYNLRCAHCHGYDGQGQLASTIEQTEQLGLHIVPAQDATGHTWQHPSQLLRQVILNGLQNPLQHYPMPGFAGAVTEEEVDHMIAYMSLWWTDEQRAWQAQVTARRAEINAEFGLNDE